MPAFQIAPDRLPPEGGRDYWKVGGHRLAVARYPLQQEGNDRSPPRAGNAAIYGRHSRGWGGHQRAGPIKYRVSYGDCLATCTHQPVQTCSFHRETELRPDILYITQREYTIYQRTYLCL